MRCDFVDVFVLCWWEASATYVPTLWLLYTCLRLRHVMTASSPIGWNPMTSCKPCHRGCILYVYTCSYRLLIWSNFVDDESWHARLDTMQVHATDYSWVQRVVDSTCSSDVTHATWSVCLLCTNEKQLDRHVSPEVGACWCGFHISTVSHCFERHTHTRCAKTFYGTVNCNSSMPGLLGCDKFWHPTTV